MSFDTKPEIDDLFISLMKKKTNEERFLMGCSMYDAARRIVESSIYEKHPKIKPGEMKKEVFLRFYGPDFSSADKSKILSSFSGEK